MKESHQSTPAEALFPLANHTVHLQVKVSTCVRDIWLHSHNSWVPLGEREVLGGGHPGTRTYTHIFRKPLAIIKTDNGLLLGVERTLHTTAQSQQKTGREKERQRQRVLKIKSVERSEDDA